MALLDFTDEFLEAFNSWNGKVGAPTPESRKTDRLRVYKNAFAEHVLASSHPILPGVWFGAFILYGFYAALTSSEGPLVGVPLYLAGVLGFSLIEYLLHRFPFHWQPGDGEKSKMWLFLIHGYHHLYPNDKRRLVAPPLMSWPLGIAIFAIYWVALPRQYVWIVFGGTTCGYLLYDWIHYYTHHFRSPKTRVGKLLRRAHAVHHYKLFHLNMGISSPLWDLAFGTFAWSDDTVKAAMVETRSVEAQTDRAERAKKSGGPGRAARSPEDTDAPSAAG